MAAETSITATSHPPQSDIWTLKLGTWLKTREGVHDAMDAAKTGCELVKTIANSVAVQDKCDALAGKFGLIKGATEFVEFFETLTGLYGHVTDLSGPEGHDKDAGKNIFKDIFVLGCSGSESLMFLNESKILPHPESWGGPIEGVFWITAGILDGWNMGEQIHKSDYYYNESQKVNKPELKSYYESARDLANLRIVKSISTVAMAALALVSLFFASLVAGVAWISTAMLGLSCVYIVLKIASHFYQKSLDDQEAFLLYAAKGK